jgi:uroporphyrinogen-III decarboxylase
MQKLLARWAGVETTIDLFYDHTDEFEEILHRIESAQLPVFDIIAKSPAEVVAFPENLSSEITGSRFFKEFNLPYYQKVNRILHKEGKKTAIHIDGTLHPCLSMLSEAGFDIAEAVTPYPCGDIRISDLRNAAGPDIILWGGIPGALFTEMFTDKEFEDHVREVLALSDDKFVLGVADQVPTDGLWHRIAAVRRLVDEKRPA